MHRYGPKVLIEEKGPGAYYACNYNDNNFYNYYAWPKF
jgi:hypothetical protein